MFKALKRAVDNFLTAITSLVLTIVLTVVVFCVGTGMSVLSIFGLQTLAYEEALRGQS